MALHTKNAIKEAFARMATQQPIERITVKELTAKSQVSRNTFYYYFHDVYDVLEEYLNDCVSRAIETIDAQLAQGVSLDEACRRMVEYQIQHQEVFYCIYQSAEKREVGRCLGRAERTLLGYIMDHMAEGTGASEEDKDILVEAYLFSLNGFLFQWMEGGNKQPLGETLARLHTMLGGTMMREALLRSAKSPRGRVKKP